MHPGRRRLRASVLGFLCRTLSVRRGEFDKDFPAQVIRMAVDQIIDLLDVMEEDEDPAWLSEFYSAVANSEFIVPMILPPGFLAPIPIWTELHSMDTLVLDPDIADYIPTGRSTYDRNFYNLLYSSPELYKSAKPVLHGKYKNIGRIVDPVTKNGRQLINAFCKKKYCAVINMCVSGSRHYMLSPEQMEIIRRKSVTKKPKAPPEKEPPDNGANGGALVKLNFYLEKNNKLERGNRGLQELLREAFRENAEMKARLTCYEKRIAELESSLAAFTDVSVPISVPEAVESAARRFSSRLVIHPGVMDTVEAWPHKKKSRCVAHTVKMLEAVARTLYGMKFESPDGYIDPLQFQAITGYELAMTEGRATKRNADLDELRHCRYEDRTVTIYAHLKKRIDRNLHMRIYIGFLEEERKILIGQVGPHMANSQTAGL